MIYTSFYENIPNLPKNIIPISIAGRAPENYNGLEYKKLAPKLDFWKIWEKTQDNDFYIENYNKRVLDNLNAQEVINELLKMVSNKNVEICLICYEKEGFCHRHLVRDWLILNGFKCEEYNNI